jgi:hypothetical protein
MLVLCCAALWMARGEEKRMVPVTCCDTAAVCLPVCLPAPACLHASPSVRTLAPFESRLSPARSKIFQVRQRQPTKPHNLERWEGEG